MKRWYQRQWWYVEKPMPWAMILLWPFLWVVGIVDELRRRFSKPEPVQFTAVPIGTMKIGSVTLPMTATAKEIHDAMDFPTQTWELPDECDLSGWFPGWVAPGDRWEIPTYRYPIVDRDYE